MKETTYPDGLDPPRASVRGRSNLTSASAISFARETVEHYQFNITTHSKEVKPQ
jgi:hypothetical protein